MAKGCVKIATCQFAVSGNIKRNNEQIQAFIKTASKNDADIVHLPECALSGYAGADLETLSAYNWQLLRSEGEKIVSLAGQLGIWTILGSMHQLTEPNKPHNSLYLISPDGRLIDRYDKRFCTERDLMYYTPGDSFVYFDVNGVKCSLLICFDLRFPEIYRALRKENVECIFQSFYNARQKGPSVHTDIMRQTMQCRAATNYFWISMANSSGWYSPYPSCFIQPDGKIVKQLKNNRSGMMINTVDINESYYDPSAPYRKTAMTGKLTNRVKKISDPRSKNKCEL